MLINRQNLDAMNKGFKSLYDSAFSKAVPQFEAIAMKVPSSASSNVYGWLGKFPGIREWIGDRTINNLKSYDFEIKNKSWEDTIAVDRDNIKDDNLGIYAPMFTMLGDAVANHPDNLVFGLLAAAFTTTCYDNQYLIDTDHPVLSENGAITSVSNHGGGSGAPWFLINDTKTIKPFIYQEREPFNFVAKDNETDDNAFFKKQYLYGVDGRNNVGVGLWQLIYGSKQTLDTANYAAARTAMTGMKGDYGTPLRLKPTLLVVGPSNEQAANEAIKAERLANGATNVNRDTAKIMVVPWLP